MKPRPTICMHLHANDDLSHVEKLANYAKELGAEYVRLDMWWNEIMPEPGKISMENMIKWGEIIGKLRSKDLEIIAILGTGHEGNLRYPEWVSEQIAGYLMCLSTCYSSTPLESKSTTLQYDIPKSIEDRIKYSFIESLKNLNIDAIVKSINQIKDKYPQIYDREKYQLLVNRYSKLNLAREYAERTGDPQTLLQAWDPCGCYRFMEDLMQKAYQYSKAVASSFGQDIDYYQLGNELNHPCDLMPAEWDAPFIYWLSQGLYEDPTDHIGIINVYADWYEWENILKSWLDTLKNLPADTIGIVAIDHYPGTWTGTHWDDWSPLDSLIQIAQKYNKTPAIMETGYPSSGWGHTEEKQASYVDVAFNAIMQRARSNYIAFLSWYMLWDEPGSEELRYSGWGVLRKDFSKKPAWYKLRDWFYE